MAKRRTDIFILTLIILCSTSFYKLKMLGSTVQKLSELAGAGIILISIIFYLIYSDHRSVKQNYILPIMLILISVITSMVSAYILRDQKFMHTMFAQRALYYYLLYFLLHQLRFNVKDLERIIVILGLVYVALYLIQFVLYPKIIFDSYVRQNRGTIRIYLPGSGYMAATFFYVLQGFLRSNRFKFFFTLILILTIYILTGGRQSLAIVVFVTVLFIIIDRKVQSRILLIFLGMIGAFAIFMLFQNIFMELITSSRKHLTMGEEYIRIQAAKYYLTDFFKSPVAYITGNGMYFSQSSYGRLISLNALVYKYNLGDIGIIGDYAMYGVFFFVGVLIICIKAFRIKMKHEHFYVKYMFIAIVISLPTSGGFADADFVCFIACILYLIDVSYRDYSALNKSNGNNTDSVEILSEPS